ncbi:MAG: hypothetical protein EOP11_16045 [Proteobacteria bacterium]|nr:MAG: hypothetical protein EOP11_16045 [Pseudomonadota bacterium]
MKLLLSPCAIGLAALTLLFLGKPAHAIKFSAVGGGNYSSTETAPTYNYSAKAAVGGGALMEIRLLPSVGLEIGALYLPRKYEISNNGYDYTTTQNQIQIPIVLRANLLNIFSLGVGGYVSKYTGKIDTQVTRTGTGPSPINASYGPAQLSTTDYGVVTSIAFYSSVSPLARFVLDARYVIGSKDNDLSFQDKKFRDFQLLAGLQVGL